MQNVPDDIEDRLEELTLRQLDQVSRLAERLAEDQRREQRTEEKEDRDDEVQTDIHGDDLPDGVPSKATLTKKKINGNEYWYWQWRDGEKIRSQYKGPVDSS
jgi:ABC-type Zn2+ transport system substrate-binding protein/surface adhesin